MDNVNTIRAYFIAHPEADRHVFSLSARSAERTIVALRRDDYGIGDITRYKDVVLVTVYGSN